VKVDEGKNYRNEALSYNKERTHACRAEVMGQDGSYYVLATYRGYPRKVT